MVTVKDVRWLRGWFRAFVAGYMTGDADLRRNMRLKESHTARVCREALAIARGLGLDAASLRMIETIVLLHDVGRFEQYRRHRTFSDAQSENHAKLTLAILRKRAVLERFTPHDRSIIRRAIAYHNLPQIPPGVKNAEVLLFSRLMRDADKLDILRLVIHYYNAHPEKKNHAIAVGLQEAQDFTPEVLADLLQGRIVRSAHLRNQNDFKLLQMGWVYDVNFVPTLRSMKRRKYLEKLRAAMPDAPEADAAYATVSAVLARRIREEA
ncbi:MAG: HD domain-containing protein [Ignavibacteriae bacterium]|nr:HD domain-containing protein [Ignavibacteriota bacterium]